MSPPLFNGLVLLSSAPSATIHQARAFDKQVWPDFVGHMAYRCDSDEKRHVSADREKNENSIFPASAVFLDDFRRKIPGLCPLVNTVLEKHILEQAQERVALDDRLEKMEQW